MSTIVRAPCDEGAIRSATSAHMQGNRGQWVLVATILGSSLAFIDGTVVNVALPALQASLGATLAQVQWVVESYALALAALLLTGGSLGDLFGRRRVFGIGVLLFAAASAACGAAASVGQLIGARAVQGVGAALLVPNSLALISVAFDPRERGRAIGTWSGFTAMTTAIGPVLGGWVVQHGSWRWAFLINIPVAAVVLAVTWLRVPESSAGGADRRIDWTGVLLTTAALGAIVYALIESNLAVGIGSMLLCVAFLVVERRASAPVLPLELFRFRDFSGANLLTLFLYAALGGVLFFVPLNLIQVQRYSATAAGSALLPFILLMFVLSRWAGGLVDRYGARLPLIVGPMIAAAGFALFAVPSVGGSYWTTFFPAVLVLGLGMTVSVAPLTTTVMSALPADRAGIASGINNAVARVAGLLAVAAFGLQLSVVFNHSLDRRLDALHLTDAQRREVDAERRYLAAAHSANPSVEGALDDSFVDGFRAVVLLAAALALGASASAALLIGGGTGAPATRRRGASERAAAA